MKRWNSEAPVWGGALAGIGAMLVLFTLAALLAGGNYDWS